MRVELAPEIFVDPSPSSGRIQAVGDLLRTFADGRHDWAVDIEDVDAATAYLDNHYPTLAYGELAEMAATQNTAWVGTTQTGRVLIVPLADLEDHASDLCRCAVIAVENIPNDKYFLVAVAHAFARTGAENGVAASPPEWTVHARRLRDAIERGWVEFRHSGGSGQLATIAQDAATYFRRTVRVVAVFDSDSLFPGHESSSATTHAKAAALRTCGVVAHVLLRREAENYAPNRVLVEVGNRRRATQRVDLLGRLLPEQRGHLDLKKGLSRTLVPGQVTLYETLDQETRSGLSQGFGDGVLRRMHELREDLSEADFDEMDAAAAADLRTLLALIDSVI